MHYQANEIFFNPYAELVHGKLPLYFINSLNSSLDLLLGCSERYT